MLRLIFVFAIVLVGGLYAVRSPFYALLFYLWNAYFRPEVWVWWDDTIAQLRLSYYAGLLIVGSALVSGRLFRAGPRLLNLQVAAIALFAGQAFVSSSNSDYYDFSWPLLEQFLKAVLITLIMIALVDDLGKLRLTVLVIVLSLGFEGAKQGWLQLIRNPGAPNQNAIPFLGDNNGVAMGMLMLVPLVGSLARTTQRPWARRLYQVILAGVVYRAITTYSRGGFLASLALGIVYWWRSRNKLRTLIGVALVAAVILPVLTDAFWDRMWTIVRFQEIGDQASLGRLHFWEVARSMVDAHPFLGVGFLAFDAAYDDFDPSRGHYGSRRSVHSVWLGVLAELGYPGLALYLAVFGMALLGCRRICRLAQGVPELGELREYAAALEASLTVFVFAGTFLPGQYNEMAWHLVGLSVALKTLARQRTAEARADARVPAPVSPETSPLPAS